jgi:hypothetical protein
VGRQPGTRRKGRTRRQRGLRDVMRLASRAGRNGWRHRGGGTARVAGTRWAQAALRRAPAAADHPGAMDGGVQSPAEAPALLLHSVQRMQHLARIDEIRDAVAACTTCVDLRMAVRTVAAQFPAAMKTIRTGYWKNSSSAAISNCDIRKSHRITPSPKQETPDVRELSTPN